jgi:hypothetical protein
MYVLNNIDKTRYDVLKAKEQAFVNKTDEKDLTPDEKTELKNLQKRLDE